MAIKIKFDSQRHVETPTLVLGTRAGNRLGKLPVHSWQFTDAMAGYPTAACRVYRADFEPNNLALWDEIKDFKLIWARDWNEWFELKVDVQESNAISKSITMTALGAAELSQLNIYNTEINTDDDIARDDYVVTVLYDENNPKASMLNRILEKAPHYTINHVDPSIRGIQRTFKFDGISIYDALQQIAEEIDCLVQVNCRSNGEGNLTREINLYDLEAYCQNCGKRGNFLYTCEYCGSSDILSGYGSDTTIFVTSENLADDITFSTDTGSVKNCFRLEGGDDLMTATIANCSPSGSPYIWYFSDEMREDMPTELTEKLDDYNTLYNYYLNEYVVVDTEPDEGVTPALPNELRAAYNDLITKYSVYSTDYPSIPATSTGYAELMELYYNAIDFYYFLRDELMPTTATASTSAQEQASSLTSAFASATFSTVAVQNLSSLTTTTATNAVLQMAKVLVDPRYQIRAASGALSGTTWTGTFVITNYSDDTDTFTTGAITVAITGNYEQYVHQKMEQALRKHDGGAYDSIAEYTANSGSTIFELDENTFKAELRKYGLAGLNTFLSCCQSCLDILIEQGVANPDNYNGITGSGNLYTQIYAPYYEKLGFIQEEIALREEEIATVYGLYDANGGLMVDGVISSLLSTRAEIQSELDMETYFGEELWKILCSYRREDTYQNSNYISDGLDNSGLFHRAKEFIEVAEKDIFKSATMQHSISATMKNLLVMREFEPLVDNFALGNWLRIRVDGMVYKLRLIGYSIDGDSIGRLGVTFSDVRTAEYDRNLFEELQQQSGSMASSFANVERQATNGQNSSSLLNGWVERGLALTTLKIVNEADNQNVSWDEHGFLCKQFDADLGDYDDCQTKIINKGLYITDDGWLTSRAGIGMFTFWNPDKDNGDGTTGGMETTYGVIADTIVGKIVLSEKVKIYNESGSVSMDENGFSMVTDTTQDTSARSTFSIKKKQNQGGTDVITDILTVDSDGNLILSGSMLIQSANGSSLSTLDNYITENYYDSQSQYMRFDPNTGLTIGASLDDGSAGRTVITNSGVSLYAGAACAAEFLTGGLYAPNIYAGSQSDAFPSGSLFLGKYQIHAGSDGSIAFTWVG